MGHVVQTGGLAVQNFVSAAVGIAVAVALVRGFARSRTGELGNFWADLVRGIVRILLPISVIAARSCWSPAAPSRTSPASTRSATFTGGTQQWNGGAVASQEAIKELGTNGGGYFNANSAHPFENPNGFTNLFEIFLMLVIPFALTAHLRHDGRQRQAGLRDPRRDGPPSGSGFIALMMWTEFAHHGPAFEIAGRGDGGQGDTASASARPRSSRCRPR